MSRQHLMERAYSNRVVQVDRDAGVIRGVKILGRMSANGREYSAPALRQAARCYEGLGVNMNHPDRGQPHLERPVQDGFGWLESVRVESDGVYGDLHFLKSHAMAGPICEAAERRPDRFGLSHNATGNVVERQGKRIVESIEQVRSVDIVQRPATTHGLFESESATPDSPRTTESDESNETSEFRSAARALLDNQSTSLPELVDALALLLDQYRDDSAVAESDHLESDQGSPVADLQRELQAARHEITVRQELAAASLPATPVRVKALLQLTESTDREALLRDWVAAAAEQHSLPHRAPARPRTSPPILESLTGSDSQSAAEMARRFNALR